MAGWQRAAGWWRQLGPSARRVVPAADSVGWLVLAAAGFTTAQLLFVPLRMGLSWDEVVYVSQTSSHAPAAFFDPARARGVPLLVAPLEAVTPSIAALRVYLAVASGLGLFLALLAWRGLRPAWLLALAAVMYGGLWAAQYWGPQAFPDEWVAFAALAAVGCFLRAVRLDAQPAGPQGADQRAGSLPSLTRTASSRGAVAGLGGAMAVAALFRPSDAFFLGAALIVAAMVVPGTTGTGRVILPSRAWRRWPVIAATVAGLAAGAAEWVAEAYWRFGGPLARLRAASAEQGGFGPHLGIWAEFKAVNGPTLCRPCTVAVRHPELGLWWLALPVLVTLGVLAAYRARRLGSSLLAAVCGLAIAAPYLFGISYAAPRFLLPAYLLFAIPVADAAAWLLTSVQPGPRPVTTGAFAVMLCLQLVAQHLVLDHEVRGTIRFHDEYARIATDLRQLGLRSPCLVKGIQHIPIAFYAGCGSAGHRPGRLAVLVHERGGQPPRYASAWVRHPLPGTQILHLAAYLQPLRPELRRRQRNQPTGISAGGGRPRSPSRR